MYHSWYGKKIINRMPVVVYSNSPADIFSESVRPCQNGSGGKNKLRNMILEMCCI